jgi:ATP-binding cassette subfamily B protein
MLILWSYLKKYKLMIVLSLFLAAINQIFSLLDPWIFRKVIDSYATKPELYSTSQFVNGVGVLLLAAVGVAFVSRVAKNFQDYFVNRMTQKVGTEMYTDGLAETMKMPYVEFEDDQSGSVLSKIQKVKTDSEKLIGLLINTLFINLVGFVFIFIYALNVYWVVAILYVAAFPVIGGVSFLLSKKIKKVQKDINIESNALAGNTTETLRNIELVKSLGLGAREIERLKIASSEILKLELKKVKYLRSLSFIQGTIVNLVRTIILGTMLYFIFTGRITFGEFFSLWIYSFFLFAPLQDIGNVITAWREAQVSLENFQEIKNRPKEYIPENPINLSDVERVEVKNVVFKHRNSELNSVENISFSAVRGQTIAFVGPTGSGKSTILKLLLGLYSPDSGGVFYNNHSIEDYNKDNLRSRIGIVTQDTQLFSGTLYENIAFACLPENQKNNTVSSKDVIAVLREAAGDSIIDRNSTGINTKIGENGIKLSGGEKQRIAIARALIRNPDVLIFDEATSALDSITEESITNTIRSLNKNRRITFLVAHRLSTIMHADVINVLQNGKIIETGTHDELLKQKGLYNALWLEQIGN